MRDLRAAVTDLLLLQHAHAQVGRIGGEEPTRATRTPPKAATTNNNNANTNAAATSTGGLWVMEGFMAPVLRRFSFHFETRRETNRRDKPEWVFSHCGNLLRMHGDFLADQLQAMLLAPVQRLQAAWVSEAAAEVDRKAYLQLLAECCPSGAYLAFAGGLCDAVHAKFAREMPGLLRQPNLFTHTLNEILTFERELRGTLQVPLASAYRDRHLVHQRKRRHSHHHCVMNLTVVINLCTVPRLSPQPHARAHRCRPRCPPYFAPSTARPPHSTVGWPSRTTMRRRS